MFKTQVDQNLLYMGRANIIRSNYFFEVNNANLTTVTIMSCFRDMQEEMNDIGKT